MHPLSIGMRYCLRLPDGRALGHLRIEKYEDQWAEGPWEAEPAFEQFRELFEREANLRRDQIIPLWEKAADAIDALKIQVFEDGGKRIDSPLRIFVEGNEAIIGMPLGIC